ncbi:MAG: NotI family restriction endonuclease [Roseiflexaceae bacterium]|nr:NotI family restriction endonuclease [Roseiflexus sp.]MDW8213175.1 NotI family restriction endonuclease [Roseiflexaceae bacterium]
MSDVVVSRIAELFGYSTNQKGIDWQKIVSEQKCPFLGKKCYKVRKSDPSISIGSCTVLYGNQRNPIIICPTRFTADNKVFLDCLDLMKPLESGNELYLIPEVNIPGGNVDFFLTLSVNGKILDFVGIETQALDTTGTVWPERQRLLRDLGVEQDEIGEGETSSHGINWKMTAKTVLVQMHHKVQTFEHIGKKMVLILQERLFDYMARQFTFDHLHNPPVDSDSLRFHVYRMSKDPISQSFGIVLSSKWGTDTAGVARCLGLQVDPRVELQNITQALEGRLSSALRLTRE